MWGTRLLFVAALALGIWLIRRTFAQYGWDQIRDAVAAIPLSRLGLAACFAAASYACLTLFDALAVRYIGHRLPYRRTALASFVSLSLGHSIGFAGLSSGAIRYRFYRRWGLRLSEVAKLVVFCGMTVGLGLAVLAGIALLADPWLAERVTELPPSTSRLVGAACLVVPALYIGVAALRPRPIRLWRWTLEVPRLRIAAAQVAVGTVNFALVAACLHQALAAVGEAPYLGVASVYVLANVATLVTHVPGGLGIIESVVTTLIPSAHVIGAVVVFRLVYFVVPLAIGTILFLILEVRRAAQRRAAERQA
ncbi:lysylphosphatidylglycerol synthase domain-containing protein [Prosthecomicrobium sp. N25]|uniref:lysylphosphatidylglycerol synthase domain-containing protein n=1 Tax=Prosthecomicrobium sp. N25 TaxID=3129254 RepID=UPI003FCE306D